MKRQLIVAGIMLPLLGWILPTNAQAIRSIPLSAARGERQIVSVELYRGYGVTLNFRPVRETIRRVWLDNPSQVTLDFDDPRCAAVREPGSCAATVIQLRRINPLQFPSIPATDATTLTVLTDTELYKFRLTFPDAGSPSYYTLEIQPEFAQTTTAQLGGRQGVQQIEQGLQVALSRNLIAQSDPLWERVQAFLRLLREGKSATEAARQAGISRSLVVRLAEMGRQATTLER